MARCDFPTGSEGSEASEVDVLRRQLQAREQELKEKEDQLKERDERLSLMTQRSETNSVMSDASYMNGVNGFGMKMQVNMGNPTRENAGAKSQCCQASTNGKCQVL